MKTRVLKIEFEKFVVIIMNKQNHKEILGHIYSATISDTTDYPLTKP